MLDPNAVPALTGDQAAQIKALVDKTQDEVMDVLAKMYFELVTVTYPNDPQSEFRAHGAVTAVSHNIVALWMNKLFKFNPMLGYLLLATFVKDLTKALDQISAGVVVDAVFNKNQSVREAEALVLSPQSSE